MALVCIASTSKVSKLCSQIITLHGKNFVTNSCQPGTLYEILFTDEGFFNKDEITNTKFVCLLSSGGKSSYCQRNILSDSFLAKTLCGTTGNLLIGMFEREDHMIGKH
jgi:hypothetical protein